MPQEICTGEHDFEIESMFSEYGEWYGCNNCHALGKREGDKVVAVKCVDCDSPAITLNEREGTRVPVCEHHFMGVIIL